MNKSLKRSKLILILGIISLVFSLIAVPLLYVILLNKQFAYLFGVFSWFDPTVQWEYVWTPESIALFTSALTAAIISTVLSWVAAGFMLLTKFNNKSLEDLKIILGVLAIVFLGPIAVLIFGCIAISRLKAQAKEGDVVTTTGASAATNPVIEPTI